MMKSDFNDRVESAIPNQPLGKNPLTFAVERKTN